MRNAFRAALPLTFCALLPSIAAAQVKPFEPTPGQPGRDVVWVPTPQVLVEKMLDMAQVTSEDVVMDLGSGDGRNIIAAARRGARAIGVEYNPDMVALSRQKAKEAGVADRATFIEGDMYEADISKATVLALFLLPVNLDKLKDKFLALPPGSRIVLNTFGVTGWDADVTEKVEENCETWCTAMLLIVPARIGGTWRFSGGEATLEQSFQTFTGTVSIGGQAVSVSDGRLKADAFSFTAGDTQYAGRVIGDRLEGTATRGSTSQPWQATRAR
jgi:precorrin-6B methylase 2